MSEKRLNVAREMHADGHSMGSIASTLRMGRSTLYRHLSPRELTERDHE